MALDTRTFNEVLNMLESVPFPASKADVINAARVNNASTKLQAACQNFPEDARFKSPQEVLGRLHLGTR